MSISRSVLAAAVMGASVASALELGSSRPENNVFVTGEGVEVTLSGPGAAGRRLWGRVTDYWGAEVDRGEWDLAGGAYTQRWSLGAPGPGYYLVSAEVRAGTGAVEKARMPLAVIAPPTAEMAAPEFRAYPFGLCGMGIGRKALTGPLEDWQRFVGGRWHRTGELTWRGVEREKGVWKFAGRIDSNDYWRVMPHISGTPGWAQKAPGSYYPSDWEGVKVYVRKAVEYYRERVRPPRVYILGNEWCGIEGQQSDFADEIRYNLLAAKEIRAADPEAQIVVYGPEANIYSEKSRAFFESGLFDLCDGFSQNYYINHAEPESVAYGDRVDEIRALLAKYGYTNKSAWITEVGYNTFAATGINDTQKAHALVRRTVMALAKNIECYIEHSPSDWEPNCFYGLVHDAEYYAGRIPTTRSAPNSIYPKESFVSYCVMVRQLTGAEYVQRLDYLGATAMGTVFRKEGKPVLVLWDYSGEPQEVELEVGVPEVRVTDLMGAERTMAAGADGALALTLTQCPVYVHGADPALFLAAGRPAVEPEPSLYRAFPGDRVTIRGYLENPFDRSLEGEWKVALPAELDAASGAEAVTLAARERKPLTVEVRVDGGAACRIYPVRLVLSEAGKPVGRGLARVDVQPPVAIVSAAPAFGEQGERSLALTLENRRDRAVSGRVSVARGGKTIREIDCRLEGGGAHKVLCPLPGEAAPDPARRWPFDVVFREADTGASVSSRMEMSFVRSARMDKPPALDGDLSEFREAPPTALKDAGLTRLKEVWRGPSDVSGTVYLGWDSEAFYLGVDVRDDRFHQEHTGVMTWLGDAIQVAFDPLPGRPQEYDQQSTEYRKKHSEYILALTTNGPSVYRSHGLDKRRPVGPVAEDEVKLAVRRTETGLVYEAAFPWESLSMGAPQPGQVLGLALTLNDLDQKGDPFLGLEWFGGIFYVKDPDRFGQVVLAP